MMSLCPMILMIEKTLSYASFHDHEPWLSCSSHVASHHIHHSLHSSLSYHHSHHFYHTTTSTTSCNPLLISTPLIIPIKSQFPQRHSPIHHLTIPFLPEILTHTKKRNPLSHIIKSNQLPTQNINSNQPTPPHTNTFTTETQS